MDEGTLEESTHDSVQIQQDCKVLVFGFKTRADANMGILLGMPHTPTQILFISDVKIQGKQRTANLCFYGFETPEQAQDVIDKQFKLGAKTYKTVKPRPAKENNDNPEDSSDDEISD